CGAAGGAGASTLAAALARVATRSHPTTLLDAVDHSGGLDLLLGVEETPGIRWPELRLGEGTVDAVDLRAALPVTPDGITCLSAARSTIADPFSLTPELVRPVLQALQDSAGVTIVDTPSHGPVADAVADSCDHVVLLIPAEVRAAAAAAGLVSGFGARRCTVAGVLRHRSWSGLSRADVEKITRCEILSTLGTVSRLSRSVELGGLPQRLPAPLATTARLVLESAGVAL
ncbi:septum site-determining protein Ssd, partial [Corynebacterium nasicanis]